MKRWRWLFVALLFVPLIVGAEVVSWVLPTKQADNVTSIPAAQLPTIGVYLRAWKAGDPSAKTHIGETRNGLTSWGVQGDNTFIRSRMNQQGAAVPGWDNVKAGDSVFVTLSAFIPWTDNVGVKYESESVESDPVAWTLPGAPGTLKIATTTLPVATVGTTYSATISSTGGTLPYSYMYQRDIDSPYPASTYITGVTWDFANEYNTGEGSDLWPSTWTADNAVLVGWGDGGGITGTSVDCRVQLGVGKITSNPGESMAFTEILGCTAGSLGCISWGTMPPPASCVAPNATSNWGYVNAVLSVDGTLYMIVGTQSGSPYAQQIYTSSKNGASWTLRSTWVGAAGSFHPYSFVQFGMDYAGARDTYVYVIGISAVASATYHSSGQNVYLARVPKTAITTNASYEFFTGTATSPSWGTWANRTPILSDSNYISWVSMSYNAGLGRYIASGRHASTDWVCLEPEFGSYCWPDVYQHHVYEAVEPWGPWKTVEYTNTWHGFNSSSNHWGLQTQFPNKWVSGDGKTAYMVWSASNLYDRYNQVKATFAVSPDGAGVPPGLSVSSEGVVTGTPTVAGAYNFTVRVTDRAGSKNTQAYSMTVNQAPPPVVVPSCSAPTGLTIRN